MKNIKKKQNEEYLDYIKTEEESTIEKNLIMKTENNFATLFEDVRHETS